MEGKLEGAENEEILCCFLLSIILGMVFLFSAQFGTDLYHNKLTYLGFSTVHTAITLRSSDHRLFQVYVYEDGFVLAGKISQPEPRGLFFFTVRYLLTYSESNRSSPVLLQRKTKKNVGLVSSSWFYFLNPPSQPFEDTSARRLFKHLHRARSFVIVPSCLPPYPSKLLERNLLLLPQLFLAPISLFCSRPIELTLH